MKLQQYYIYKISTNRIKKSKYSINLTIEQARKSGEIVSIGDSQLLRSLRLLKSRNMVSNLDSLLLEKRRIKNKKYSLENSARLIEIEKEIDNILFVPEIISVLVSDVRQYNFIGENGFFVNGKKYKRFICGAGQARRNNALFVSEDVFDDLLKILDNDRNPEIPLVPAKYSAYFSLASSATLEVSEPYFCVVPDCKVKRKETVDFVVETENGDDYVETREEEIEFNLWDGQGLISPKMAQKWSDDLGLNYTPSAFIVRANFIKGMVCVFDFHAYAEDVAENHYVTDVWGKRINIRDMDIILTESQFKLWNTYDSLDSYLSNCRKNHLGWGVSRFSPKNEKRHTFLNYQFIQALNLDENQIKAICQKTIDYFSNVTKNDISFTLLYLLGKIADEGYDTKVLDKIHDNVTKALVLNNELIQDSYVRNYILHTLNKKIKESYIGNLLVNGSYTMMVADPYAFMEYLFQKPVVGLLARNEHYNQYWLSKGKKKIAAMRAPLTWQSEVNILNLKNNEKIDFWYKNLNNCVIYNVHGIDCLLAGGSDYDGDIVCVTDNQQIIDGAVPGNAVHYATKPAPKCKIVNSELYKYDINGFNNKVGFVTNVATTAFSMLPFYSGNSPQHAEMISRLKRLRKEQGSTIDATKGLIIKPFPVHWTKWQKVNKEDGDDEKTRKDFHNSLVIDKRPYFMRYVYPKYNKKYREYRKKFEEHAKIKFNKLLVDVLDNPQTEDENIFVENYHKFNPLLESNCLMNKISRYMEETVKELKLSLNYPNHEDNIILLKDADIPTDTEKYKKLYDLYKVYKKGKKNFDEIYENGSRKYKTIEQYNKSIRQEAYAISSNGAELANLAVDICYVTHPNDNKSFAWSIFGVDIVKNVYKNRQKNIKVPFIDSHGSIEYLGERYSMFSIDLSNGDFDNEFDF